MPLVTRVPNYLHLEATHAALRATGSLPSSRTSEEEVSSVGARGGDAEPPRETSHLWQRAARAFRLMDVAEGRPDPALTRRIAAGLLDEISGSLDGIRDHEQRTSLERAVSAIRRALMA